MKKLIVIISGVSIAALVGGVSLADENDKDQKPKGDEAQGHESSHVIQQQGRVLLDSDWNEGDGDEAQSPDLTHTRTIVDEGKTIGHIDHGKTTVDRAADGDGDDSRGKKKDEDG